MGAQLRQVNRPHIDFRLPDARCKGHDEPLALARHRPDPVSGDVPRPARRQPGGQGAGAGIWALETRDIRTSATDRHRSVDDTPAGGGPGMVCAPICWPPRSMPPERPERQRTSPPADEPARSAIDPARVRELAADRAR